MSFILHIISFLLTYVKSQQEIIASLVGLIAVQNQSRRPEPNDVTRLEYRSLTIDQMPKIQKLEKLDFKQLIDQHFDKTGKVLKPVQRRRPSSQVKAEIVCPRCSAPHDYIYKNNGEVGQYLCKVCHELFNEKNKYSKDVQLLCPHCQGLIQKTKQRQSFDIYKCHNKKCPYYLNKLAQLTKKERTLFQKKPYAFKMHYIFRSFHLDINQIEEDGLIKTNVDLSRIHSSDLVLGLILTYHVNYGLSAAKTAALLYDVHKIRISGQTIRNYAKAVAGVVFPFTDQYPYELSGQFSGDETYIRVKGHWHYIDFFFDTQNKIILAQRISKNRDTTLAVKAIYDVVKRYKEIPEDLTFIVDGNPIYLLAQQYFAQHDIHFEVKQVIGLTNEDPVSTEFRPLKQIIERLNRIYKANYRSLGGFKVPNASLTHVALFTAFFNFLRPHSALESSRVPVQIPELCDSKLDMPAKWIMLINLAHKKLAST